MVGREDTAPTPLELHVERGGDGSKMIMVIHVTGDVDLDGAPELVRLAKDILDPPPQQLVISVGGATFVDSGGLRAVLELKELADQLGVSFGLQDVTPRIQRLLEMTGLADLIGRTDLDRDR